MDEGNLDILAELTLLATVTVPRLGCIGVYAQKSCKKIIRKINLTPGWSRSVRTICASQIDA
jgi:hypothetical protein